MENVLENVLVKNVLIGAGYPLKPSSFLYSTGV
jgi:hypothetical protein